MVNGKYYTITCKKKPSERIARQLMDEKISKVTMYGSDSFKAVAEKYVDAKSNILSPSSYREYKRIISNLPDYLLQMDAADIDAYTLQKFVNEHSAAHKPKTTSNVYGFIMSVLKFYDPAAVFKVTLPQNHRSEPYIPTFEDVKLLFEYSKDSEFYVALYLASMSLRRSEICALTIDDLNGDDLVINKAMVQDINKKWIVKDCPKTDASNRIVTIPREVAERIREQGYIYKYNPNAIDNYLRRTLKKLDIPVFSLHKLRHFFASYSHELGYSDAIIQSIGGWSTDHVMKRVYRHAMNESQARKQLTDDFRF